MFGIYLGCSSSVHNVVNKHLELLSRVFNEIHSTDSWQLRNVAIVELIRTVPFEREASAMVSPANPNEKKNLVITRY